MISIHQSVVDVDGDRHPAYAVLGHTFAECKLGDTIVLFVITCMGHTAETDPWERGAMDNIEAILMLCTSQPRSSA